MWAENAGCNHPVPERQAWQNESGDSGVRWAESLQKQVPKPQKPMK